MWFFFKEVEINVFKIFDKLILKKWRLINFILYFIRLNLELLRFLKFDLLKLVMLLLYIVNKCIFIKNKLKLIIFYFEFLIIKWFVLNFLNLMVFIM